MADTIRTVAYILTSLYQDGQPPSSISEQDHRDVVVSLLSLMSPPFVTLVDGATVTLATSGNPITHAIVTLGGNRTLDITGEINGSSGLLKVIQDGTGSRTLTLPAGSKAAGGPFALSTAPGSIDELGWIYDGVHFIWTIGKAFA